jgi:hypothetical protein
MVCQQRLALPQPCLCMQIPTDEPREEEEEKAGEDRPFDYYTRLHGTC